MEKVNLYPQKREQQQHISNFSCENLKQILSCVVYKECRDANCLCECEGDICRQEPFEHCNIIKNGTCFQNAK